VLPFEGLYQRALDGLVPNEGGLTDVVVRLGPFGGAQGASGWLVVWALAFLALLGGAGLWAFGRRDL
jgi:hypothetical protein